MSNIVTVAFGARVEPFLEALERALSDAAVDAVLMVIPAGASAATVDELPSTREASALFEGRMRLHRRMRAVETAGKPVAAALCGTAIGAAFECALAAHRRVAADDASARFGVTDVSFGFVPGAGATQRLPRTIGIARAVPLLLESRTLRPREALEAGAVDALVPGGREIAEAKRWLKEKLADAEPSRQPWDAKGFNVPGGAVESPAMQQYFTAANAMLREKTFGNYPAAIDVLSCVYEGLHVDIDTGLKIEARYFAHAARTPAATNMRRLLRYGVPEVHRSSARPPEVAPAKFAKAGVLGAGMMGAAIAAATANAGIDVVLIDVSQEAAERGKAYARGDAARRRIAATTDFAQLDGADIVIEAVFEDRAVKAAVTAEAEERVAHDAVIASNTSTLPISRLAAAVRRPERFVGLHFFSPADRMPLVEIIVGEQTGDAALARAMDFVRAIGKTPIVVKDSRGFYTSRVFATYITEGLAMLGSGVAPASIDNAGRTAGMPVGPLALTDEVSVELIYKVNKATRADLGATFVQTDAERVAIAMVERYGRLGKKNGRGFYEYGESRRRLWEGLGEAFPPAADQPAFDDIVERLVAIQSIEAARCLEEGIVARPIDADVGALLGWGYPAFRGGPLGWIDTVGIERFVDGARRLRERFGPRFEPPQLLLEMAAKRERFYP